MRVSEAGDPRRMNPAYEKFRNYIDSLVQMGVVELFTDEKGEERVSMKVPLQSLLWQGLRMEKTRAPKEAAKIPGWIAELANNTIFLIVVLHDSWQGCPCASHFTILTSFRMRN